MKNYVLAYDYGTQSVRALIFDKEGNTLGKVKREFKPAYFSLKAGWAEQYPEFYWDNLCAVSEDLRKHVGEEIWSGIKAVSVTTFRDAVICLDKEGKPLRPVILWLDQRKMQNAGDSVPPLQKAVFKTFKMYDTVVMQREATFCNWIKQNEPEIWNKTYKYAQFSAFISLKLTGKIVDSVASQIGHFPFDYKHKRWMKASDIKRCIFDCTNEQMVELVKPGSVMGYVTAEAAAQTGLPEGLPVVASGSDKGCETLATGCVGREVASLSLGTSASVQITTDRYVTPALFMPAYPSLFADKYNPETLIFRGYWMITWFKKEFAEKEVKQAAEMGISAEELLDRRLKEIPPGSHGLVLQPYWSPGIKTPSAKGAIIGFSDVHTRIHLYRAIIEGIGYALLDGLKRMEKRAGYNIKRLTVSGGGSNSDAICQMTADITGLTVQKIQTYESSALGAAMAAFVGIGDFTDLEQAVSRMSRVTKEYFPDKNNHEIYKKLYENVYKKLYRRNKKFYKEIKEVLQDYDLYGFSSSDKGGNDGESIDNFILG